MKKTALLLALFLTLSLFSSCITNEHTSCREILDKIIISEVSLPAGQIYSSRAEKGENEYMSASLINSIYGNGTVPPMADGWIEVAIFLPSSSHPCEFAVFLCDSRDTANDTARMLCSRLDAIRTAKGTKDNMQMINSAEIAVVRNYVLFILSSDSKNALKAAKKAMR